jgi:hypothetical protein
MIHAIRIGDDMDESIPGLARLLGATGQEPMYANHAEVTHNSMEIKLRFNKMTPSYHKTETEIILPPIVAKALIQLVRDEVDTYEREIGPIYMPDDMSGIKGLFGVEEESQDGKEAGV